MNIRGISVVALVVLLAGCTHMHKPPDALEAMQMVQKTPESELDELMRYYDSLSDRSEAELNLEYDHTETQYREKPNIQHRLRLLILLLLPDTDFQDTKAVLALLEAPASSMDVALEIVAFENLLKQLLEQQKNSEQKIQNLSSKLRAAGAEVKTLRDKIDAIKNIEKNLMRKNSL